MPFFIPITPPVIAQIKHCACPSNYIADGSRPRAARPYHPKVVFLRVHSVGVDQNNKGFCTPPIKHMDLPKPGWWTSKGMELNDSSYGYSFAPTKYGTKADLSFQYSESEKIPLLGKLFEKDPHDLTNEEKSACLDSTNVIKVARTMVLNGRKVLEVEEAGELCMEPIHIYELILDRGNSSSPENFSPVIIKFYAKGDAYNRYIGSVKEALKTIRWQ